MVLEKSTNQISQDQNHATTSVSKSQLFATDERNESILGKCIGDSRSVMSFTGHCARTCGTGNAFPCLLLGGMFEHFKVGGTGARLGEHTPPGPPRAMHPNLHISVVCTTLIQPPFVIGQITQTIKRGPTAMCTDATPSPWQVERGTSKPQVTSCRILNIPIVHV